MYITNNDYNSIKAALNILHTKKTTADEKTIIETADNVLSALTDKKRKDNKRIAGYIAEKRKTNKNYARGCK